MSAQNAQITPRIFNARDGLPDNKVAQLLETQNSPFWWAITSNELCRFDGYRFTTIWEKLPDLSGMAENERGELVLWHLPKHQKISVFDPQTGQKQTRDAAEIPGLQGQLISVWTQDTAVFVVMATRPPHEYEVFRLFSGFRVQLLHRLRFAENPTAPSMSSATFQWDEREKILWYGGRIVGGSNLIFRIHPPTGRTDTVRLPVLATWQGKVPACILRLPDGRVLLFSGESGEVWAWAAPRRQFEMLTKIPGPAGGLTRLGSDQQGRVAFRRGLLDFDNVWMLDADGQAQRWQGILPKLHYSSCSGRDFSRQIHFATLEGVLRANIEANIFQTLRPPPEASANYFNRAFRGMANIGTGGRLWLASEMMGLFEYLPAVGNHLQKVPVRTPQGNPILPDNALDLRTDAQGFVWLARNSANPDNLLRIDPKNCIADVFPVRNARITAFTLLRNGHLLIAATDDKKSTLLLLDPATRAMSPLADSDRCSHLRSSPMFLLEGAAGKIWLGCKEGLFQFDPAHPADILPMADAGEPFPVAVIFAEGDAALWCGTLGGGLQRLDLASGEWDVFTMANGLPSNKIAGILPDENGNLWISTYDGLSFFQPGHKLFTNFFTTNGLADNEFNRFSFFKNTDGTLFFGGLNGVSFFRPAELLASFSQGNDSLLVSQVSWFAPDGKTRIEQIFDLPNLEKITLPPENRFCSIRLALANFLQPEANRFAWMLEGYDSDWRLNGTSNEITFHYLPAGTYRLRVKAANPTGIWGKNEHVITLVVREFWYKTGWFVALLAAVVAGFSYLYYRYKIRQKLEHAENLRIKELDLLKTRLYTNITHEFRTPLTVIMGMAERLTEDGGRLTATEAKTGLGLINRNSQNLLRLINQLLDLSKLDAGMMRLHLIRADIINYLQYLTESFYSLAQERGVRLVFYPETTALDMDFDEEKVQHIISNLLSNALKFTASGGKVVLHAARREQGGEPFLQLKIQDTGAGIAADQLPHIFDRFYQADNSATRKTEGTGIGLSLTKELVELMGGSIRAESEVGKGSTFTVLLPVRTEAGTAGAHPRTANILAQLPVPQHIEPPVFRPAAAANLEHPVLLLIEDNADVVTYLVGILATDYQIEVARNGREGIGKAFELVPDIVISDVMMPEKDGYEVCHTLKTDERTSHIPIVLLTAKAAQEDKLVGLRVGADAYLQKPFDKKELLVRLEKLVALRQKLQERNANSRDLAARTASKTAAPPPTLDDLFLEKIRRVILEKMDDTELGILHLCRAANLSHTQVFRKLKALTGQSPTLFIRRLRLERAAELLKTTELNISEIAYEVGFSDPNYFSRAFHETFGEPPSAMRN